MTGLRVRGVDDGSVFFVSGELDMATADEFEKAVSSCLSGEGEVVLDISEVSFMDSTGIRATLRLARQLGDRPLVLRRPTPTVDRVLHVVQIDDIANISIERD